MRQRDPPKDPMNEGDYPGQSPLFLTCRLQMAACRGNLTVDVGLRILLHSSPDRRSDVGILRESAPTH